MAHRIGSRKERTKAPKVRLIELLLERGLCDSEDQAARCVLAGEVRVNNETIDKVGARVSLDAELSVQSSSKLVGRGGLKLEGAIQNFGINIENLICADVGSSTGGFTQVLLNSGANKVYAIDVGYGELDWRIRSDKRVCVMERTNARYLESLPEHVGFVTIDVSFISLSKILPAVKKWLANGARVLCLVKPQFEAKKGSVGAGGIVRDPEVHRVVLKDTISEAARLGFSILNICRSTVRGAKGNLEFFLLLGLGEDGPFDDLGPIIESVLELELNPA